MLSLPEPHPDMGRHHMVPGQVAELIKRRGFFGYVKPGVRD